MIDANPGTVLAVVVTALASLGVVVALLLARRSVARVAAESQSRHYELCEGFAELAVANAIVHREIDALAQRVERVGRTLAVPQASAHGRAYDLAARLAAAGAASSELVASCGLTPAEADLAVLVHGPRSHARTAVH